MMLTPLVFSYDQCLQETQELKAFLGSHTSLRERDEILPFKQRKHLSAYLSVNNARAITYDRVAHEYPMFGDFTCDLVAGDWSKRAYVFVEFENAAPKSIFVKKKGKNNPEWSPRFEHGFSQILDWFYKLDTQRQAVDFQDRFGDRVVYVTGVLVVGRKQDFGPKESDRLNWRHQHIAINGKQIYSMTFDDLCEDTLARLSAIPMLQKALKTEEEAAVNKNPPPIPPTAPPATP